MPSRPREKKRLRERFGAQPVSPADREAHKAEWLKIQREFARLGINPVLLTYVAVQARVGRCDFEEDLATPLVRPIGRARALTRALKHVDALSPLLEGERDADDARISTRFLNPLKKEIARQLEHLKRTTPAASRVPRNLPGDPWLKPCVRTLARYLRACKVSQHRTEGIIERIFVVTGHQDRVTREKVRDILREARRSDPNLGLTPATIKKLPYLLENLRPRF